MLSFVSKSGLPSSPTYIAGKVHFTLQGGGSRKIPSLLAKHPETWKICLACRNFFWTNKNKFVVGLQKVFFQMTPWKKISHFQICLFPNFAKILVKPQFNLFVHCEVKMLWKKRVPILSWTVSQWKVFYYYRVFTKENICIRWLEVCCLYFPCQSRFKSSKHRYKN